MRESLLQRIDELKQQLDSHKDDAEKLELEAQKWIRKRNSLNDKIRNLKEETKNLRERRDAFNKQVEELKGLRNTTILEHKEKTTQIAGLKKKWDILIRKKPAQSAQTIQKEINNLEWKIQTSSLPVEEETPLIDQIRIRESRLSIHQQIQQLKERITETQTKEEALEKKIQILHTKLTQLAEQSQNLHEKMQKSVVTSRSLQSDADNAHQKWLQSKHKAEETRKECAEISHQMRSLQQKLRKKEEEKQAKRRVELLEEFEVKALSKLNRGEKLTWEEFKLLTEQRKIRSEKASET